jgi:enterobacteria phage integrase
LAFDLLLNTGRRRSDVFRIAWSHIVTDNKINVVLEKRGRRLVILLHRDLLAALAAAKQDHVSILTTMYGRPFTDYGDAAGLHPVSETR